MPKNKDFFVRVNGQLISVTEEVYLAYYRSKRRDRYYERDIKTETAVRDKNGNIIGNKPAKEDSLERRMEAGEDYADESRGVEDAVLTAVIKGNLLNALRLLTDDERELINELFFSNDGIGMSERRYATINDIPRKTVAYRKGKILLKLKKLLKM